LGGHTRNLGVPKGPTSAHVGGLNTKEAENQARGYKTRTAGRLLERTLENSYLTVKRGGLICNREKGANIQI